MNTEPKILLVGNDNTNVMEAIKTHKPDAIIVDDTKPDTEWELQKNRSLSLAALEAFCPGALRNLYRRKPVHISKCGLPGCQIESPRDYCCAQHCKEHKEMQRCRQ